MRCGVRTLYPHLDLTTAFLNSTYKKYSSLCVGKERFGSDTESRLYKHARVMASWVGDEGEISLGISRPGLVNYFLNIHFLLIRNSMEIVLLMCSGLKSILTIRYLRTHCLFTMLRYLNFPVLQHSSLFKEFSLDLLLLTEDTTTLIL